MLKTQCPKCKQPLQVADQSLGQPVRCPRCGQTMMLRAPSAPAPSPPVAPAVKPPPAPPPAARPKPAPIPEPEPPTVLEAVEEVVELAAADDPPPAAPVSPAADFPELGGVVKVYRTRRFWIGAASAGAVLILSGPLAALADTIGSKALFVPSIIVSAAALVTAFGCGIWGLLSFKRRAELREHGFVSYGPFAVVPCAWTDLAAMYVVRTGLFTRTEIRFERKDGKCFDILSVVRGQDELADRVTEATTPRLTREIYAALDRGETVQFGRFISVDPKYLRFRPDGPKGREHRLRWNEIDSFVMGRYQANPGAGGMAGAMTVDQFHILSDGELPWVVATGNVANLSVFLGVLKNRFGVKIPKG